MDDLEVALSIINDDEIEEAIKQVLSEKSELSLLQIQEELVERFRIMASYRKLKRIVMSMTDRGDIEWVRRGKRIVYRIKQIQADRELKERETEYMMIDCLETQDIC